MGAYRGYEVDLLSQLIIQVGDTSILNILPAAELALSELSKSVLYYLTVPELTLKSPVSTSTSTIYHLHLCPLERSPSGPFQEPK